MPKDKPWCYGNMDSWKTGNCSSCNYRNKCYEETFAPYYTKEEAELQR